MREYEYTHNLKQPPNTVYAKIENHFLSFTKLTLIVDFSKQDCDYKKSVTNIKYMWSVHINSSWFSENTLYIRFPKNSGVLWRIWQAIKKSRTQTYVAHLHWKNFEKSTWFRCRQPLFISNAYWESIEFRTHALVHNSLRMLRNRKSVCARRHAGAGVGVPRSVVSCVLVFFLWRIEEFLVDFFMYCLEGSSTYTKVSYPALTLSCFSPKFAIYFPFWRQIVFV